MKIHPASMATLSGEMNWAHENLGNFNRLGVLNIPIQVVINHWLTEHHLFTQFTIFLWPDNDLMKDSFFLSLSLINHVYLFFSFPQKYFTLLNFQL